MTALLKQSTTVTILMGPALDATDGVTEEVALSPSVLVSKAGAAQVARNSATAITHDADGYYRVELNGTDTNTLGRTIVQFRDPTTHLPVWHEFMVVSATTYEALVTGTAYGTDNKALISTDAQDLSTTLDVRTKTVTAGAITSAAFGAGAITATSIATDAIGSDELALSAVNEIRDAILSDSTPFAGANIGAIKTVTDLLPDGGALTSLPTAVFLTNEISDAFSVDVITLPGQVTPPDTPTRDQMNAHLYKAYKNKTEQTSAAYSLYNNAGTIVDQTAPVSDAAGVTTVGAVVAGP